ncbi:MAG: hypothetical protein R3F59_34100, partial [Myxococcota bacterium]
EDVGRTVSATLGAPDVARTLHGPRALLVLDNLEQLVEDPELLPLLQSWCAAGATLLCTSRARLGADGEREVGLAPLPVPEKAARALGAEAWSLLRGAAPAGALDGVPPDTALALLRTLDGLPLALELAAARLEVLGVDELVARLDAAPLRWLAGPDGGSLQRAIASSWALLDEAGRLALAEAAVFRGPIAPEAARAVLTDASALDDLVRHSLVQQRSDPADHVLLPSIRAFAEARLEGEARAAAQRRHARWFADRVRAFVDDGEFYLDPALLPELSAIFSRALADPSLAAEGWLAARGVSHLMLRGPSQHGLLHHAERALGLDPAVDPDSAVQLRIDHAHALRLAERFDESRRELEALVDVPGARPLTRHRVLFIRGDLDTITGRDAEAVAWLERALAVLDPDDPRHLARRCLCQSTLAVELHCVGQLEHARQLVDEVVPRLPQLADIPRTEVSTQIAWLQMSWNDWAGAARAYEEALRVSRLRGDRRRALNAVAMLGLIDQLLGDYTRAEARTWAVAHALRETGELQAARYDDGVRACAIFHLGRWEEADALLAEMLAVQRPDDDHRLVEQWHQLRALARCRAGDVAGADPLGAPGRLLATALAIRHTERARAAALLSELRAGWFEPPMGLNVRVLFGLLVRDLHDELSHWWIGPGAEVVLPPHADPVPVGRHAANARILAHLVDAAGAACDTEALAAAGWPGERILKTASNRVRVALSGLRRDGMGPLVEHTPEGWRLPDGLRLRRGLPA